MTLTRNVRCVAGWLFEALFKSAINQAEINY
jgi:hypothetical protein